jgi:hypothetical protein
MASTYTKDAVNVYAPLVMVSIGHGKGHLPARQFIPTVRLIPILTPLRFHKTVSTFKVGLLEVRPARPTTCNIIFKKQVNRQKILQNTFVFTIYLYKYNAFHIRILGCLYTGSIKNIERNIQCALRGYMYSKKYKENNKY